MTIRFLIIISFFSLISCRNKTDKRLIENNIQIDTFYYDNGQIERIIPYKNNVMEGTFLMYYKNGILKEKHWVRKGKSVFYEKFDSLGKYISDYRYLEVFKKKDTIFLGEKYKAGVHILGYRPCSKIIYAVSEPIEKNDSFDNKLAWVIKNITNDSAYFELPPQKKTGTFKFMIMVAIRCDTATYPRNYDGTRYFEVIDKKERAFANKRLAKKLGFVVLQGFRTLASSSSGDTKSLRKPSSLATANRQTV